MKKEQGATSCSTRAPRQPLMHVIFNPHHGLLSTGYYAHLPDGETEAQRSANGSSGVMQPESGGAGLWAGNPGCVHGARPNAGSEKCRQAEEGELAQGPWGAPPPAWLPVPTRGAAGAAHCLSHCLSAAQAQPVRSPSQVVAGIANQSTARALDPDAGSGQPAPSQGRASRWAGQPSPATFLIFFEFPGARAALSDPAAAGCGGYQCLKCRVRKELCSKYERDAGFQRRSEKGKRKILSLIVLMLITSRSDVISERLFLFSLFESPAPSAGGAARGSGCCAERPWRPGRVSAPH